MKTPGAARKAAARLAAKPRATPLVVVRDGRSGSAPAARPDALPCQYPDKPAKPGTPLRSATEGPVAEVAKPHRIGASNEPVIPKSVKKCFSNFVATKRPEHAPWAAREGWGGEVHSEYVAVVEAHKTGWPHVNVLLHAPHLAKWLPSTPSNPALVSAKLLELVTRAGWGKRSTAERARSTDALAGYVAKCAARADATAGELAKLTQLPLNAPQRFRRVRSSKGFLPPRKKNEAITGTLVRQHRHFLGHVIHAEPLHRLKPPEMLLAVACCLHEEEFVNGERVRQEIVFRHPELAMSDSLRAPPDIITFDIDDYLDEARQRLRAEARKREFLMMAPEPESPQAVDGVLRELLDLIETPVDDEGFGCAYKQSPTELELIEEREVRELEKYYGVDFVEELEVWELANVFDASPPSFYASA